MHMQRKKIWLAAMDDRCTRTSGWKWRSRQRKGGRLREAAGERQRRSRLCAAGESTRQVRTGLECWRFFFELSFLASTPLPLDKNARMKAAAVVCGDYGRTGGAIGKMAWWLAGGTRGTARDNRAVCSVMQKMLREMLLAEGRPRRAWCSRCQGASGWRSAAGRSVPVVEESRLVQKDDNSMRSPRGREVSRGRAGGAPLPREGLQQARRSAALVGVGRNGC